MFLFCYTRECKMYSTKGKKLLIIDDDEDINNLFKMFLEYDGYAVMLLPIR